MVVAKTREQALAAIDAVKADYAPLPELRTTAHPLAPDAVQIHPYRP